MSTLTISLDDRLARQIEESARREQKSPSDRISERSFKELQKRVILRFLERLRDDLQSTFGPEWSVELELDPSDRRSPYLFTSRKSWPEWGSSLFGVGCVRATGAMPAELDPLARRRCRPTGGGAPTTSF